MYRRQLHDNKIRHFNEAITAAEGNSRQLYAIARGLMGKTKCNSLPETQDDKALANEFATFFMNKIETIRNHLLQHSIYQPSGNTDARLLHFSEVSEDLVIKILKTSKPTTCANDPISSVIVKDNINCLAPLITQIINKSLQSGTFADCWKTAVVTPLLKKEGLDLVMSNFRPVSNLGFLSKIAEKCVIHQLNQHLSLNNLNSDHQSAYKESFSTETTLCALINNLLWSLERGQATVLVSLDLSAAFDTVDHSVLIDLLNHNFGLSNTTLEWVRSYLQDRKLVVKIRQDHSACHTFNFSVPQGSCLGPVLFNIYCSTITDCVDNNQSISGYADDHCLYDSFKFEMLGMRPIASSVWNQFY